MSTPPPSHPSPHPSLSFPTPLSALCLPLCFPPHPTPFSLPPHPSACPLCLPPPSHSTPAHTLLSPSPPLCLPYLSTTLRPTPTPHTHHHHPSLPPRPSLCPPISLSAILFVRRLARADKTEQARTPKRTKRRWHYRAYRFYSWSAHILLGDNKPAVCSLFLAKPDAQRLKATLPSLVDVADYHVTSFLGT